MTTGKRKQSTLAALLEEKPRRGRPRRLVSRQNVYVAFSEEEKQAVQHLSQQLPNSFNRADVPDLAITVLATRLESLRRAVAGRTREIPEGITDLDSLYILWDLSAPTHDAKLNWTSVRVSPQQVIELGRVHGSLNALFGATRSQVFSLGLSLLEQFLQNSKTLKALKASHSLEEFRIIVNNIYL